MSQDEAVKKAVESMKAGGFKVEPFAHQSTGTEHSIFPAGVDTDSPSNACGNIGLDTSGNIAITLSCRK